jgi:hypothetical protein
MCVGRHGGGGWVTPRVCTAAQTAVQIESTTPNPTRTDLRMQREQWWRLQRDRRGEVHGRHGGGGWVTPHVCTAAQTAVQIESTTPNPTRIDLRMQREQWWRLQRDGRGEVHARGGNLHVRLDGSKRQGQGPVSQSPISSTWAAPLYHHSLRVQEAGQDRAEAWPHAQLQTCS